MYIAKMVGRDRMRYNVLCSLLFSLRRRISGIGYSFCQSYPLKIKRWRPPHFFRWLQRSMLFRLLSFVMSPVSLDHRKLIRGSECSISPIWLDCWRQRSPSTTNQNHKIDPKVWTRCGTRETHMGPIQGQGSKCWSPSHLIKQKIRNNNSIGLSCCTRHPIQTWSQFRSCENHNAGL